MGSFKRSKGRCEVCGITNDKKALEVDHILPRAMEDLMNYI